MTPAQRVAAIFRESMELKQKSIALAPSIAAAADRLVSGLARGNKVLVCGNGGSAADAQHLAAELVNRFETKRRALAAIALTTDTSALTSIGNDLGFERVFARQVEALGNAGDTLVVVSTSGDSANIVAAVAAAKTRGMVVIALTGRDGGAVAEALTANDCEIRIPGSNTARIQETHLVVIHALCALVDDAVAQPAGAT